MLVSSSSLFSFADKMIVIQNNRIVANSDPQDLYKNPKSNYVASLFDDVNELKIDGKNELVYPHQIKIIKDSPLKAVVLNTYFRGFYWLIEVNFEGQIVFLTHHELMDSGQKVCLRIHRE